MEEKTLTYPFETVTITSIDRFCAEIAAVVYDTPEGVRCIKICRTNDALRSVRVGDTVKCSTLGEQWSAEYMAEVMADYRGEGNVEVPIGAPLGGIMALWCFDRGITLRELCLALSLFLCDRRTETLACELYERYRGEKPVLDTENE